ncbi:transposase [Arthrobacter livingstonensis]|uniref:transposase n=1 Tax=Arthrobacter livingstonensis TaxID=670078 RepID=UPI0034D33832
MGGGTGAVADRGTGHRHDCREAWVVDDTGLDKEGTVSPGLERQDSGTPGKIGNFQIAVSLQAATDDASCPLNLLLYRTEAWDDTCAGNNGDSAVTTERRVLRDSRRWCATAPSGPKHWK